MPIDPKAIVWDEPQKGKAAPSKKPAGIVWDDENIDPTEGMSTGQKVLAGIGKGMYTAYQGLAGLVGAGESDAERAERNALDAPLMATKSGKVGNVIGTAAAAAPVMLVPGANTYGGAAMLGGLAGTAMTPGGAQERLEGGIAGAVGGAAGKFVGDSLGAGARALKETVTQKLTQRAAANAGTDTAVAAAREAGYVVTPAMTNNPGFLGSLLESVGGKIKTQQAASLKNQEVTNALAASHVGLPKGGPISQNALAEIRQEAGKAYQAVAGLGELPVSSGAKLPAGVTVQKGANPLTLAPEAKVSSAELVSAWKQANHDATGYFKAYARDANPETLAKAKAAAGAAKEIDAFLEDALKKTGQNDLLSALKEARTTIAKTYSVENALNPATGGVSAKALAKQLDKGKPLSGDLLKAAQFAKAFPKAAQEGVSVPSYSVFDAAMAGGAAGTLGSPLLLALLAGVAARPGARSLVLSKPMQNALARTNYTPNALARYAPEALDNEIANFLVKVGGVGLGVAPSK